MSKFDRRDFLKLIGVASGASALAGCDLNRQSEKLIPYLVPPADGLQPEDATYVASACTECPAGCAVTARIREDRPVKVDGAAGHPVNDGALCVRGQASLNRLYLPERLRGPMSRNETGELVETTWDDALARIAAALADSDREDVYLSGQTSGTLSALVDEFCRGLGVTRLPEFEVFSHATIREANRELFDRPVVPWYDIGASDFLLTVGADIVDTFQNPVAHAAAISAKRSGSDHFAWYHAEPHASLTGFQSEHRLSVAPGTEAHLLAFLLHEIGNRRIFTNRRLESYLASVPRVSLEEAARTTGVASEELEALAQAFTSAHHPLVIAGGVSTAGPSGLDVARLAALIQAASGMVGSTIDFTRARDASRVGNMQDFKSFTSQLQSGRVGVCFISETDPVARSSEGERFGKAVGNASLAVGIGDVLNDTLSKCDVVLPVSHALESWGDVEPRRGVVNVIQPALTPLFDTLSNGDILLRVMAAAGRPVSAADYQAYAISRWTRVHGAVAARELVDKGYFEAGAGVSRDVPALTGRAVDFSFLDNRVDGPWVYIAPSLRWYDGRSAELPLLHEVPDPVAAVSWGSFVSVSPESGIEDREMVELSMGGWTGSFPARTQPGLGKDVFVLQRGADNLPSGVFGNVPLEDGAVLAGVKVTRTAQKAALAVLSGSLTGAGRGAPPGDHPEHFGHPHSEGHEHEDVSFNPEPESQWKDYRWGMAIDLDLCTGCSACVAACYVENNVPMTGEDEHLKGREMSWIRIEPYYDDHGGAEFVPAMCQHCDAAPCEPVCPVFATYTNEEGLNAQIYNRCVGTRYCANNCPYKMRRFNWFSWEHRPEPLNLMSNPDVSMRGKGIMEKCSFCVQRIRKARHDAKDRNKDNWVIEDGEVTPACAQACPANAIAFGNLLDEDSQVSKLARSERSNRWLEELGAGPAVFYLRTKGNHHDA